MFSALTKSKNLKDFTGKDATKEFNSLHNDTVLKTWGPKLYIGDVGEASNEVTKVPKNEVQFFLSLFQNLNQMFLETSSSCRNQEMAKNLLSLCLWGTK